MGLGTTASICAPTKKNFVWQRPIIPIVRAVHRPENWHCLAIHLGMLDLVQANSRFRLVHARLPERDSVLFSAAATEQRPDRIPDPRSRNSPSVGSIGREYSMHKRRSAVGRLLPVGFRSLL